MTFQSVGEMGKDFCPNVLQPLLENFDIRSCNEGSRELIPIFHNPHRKGRPCPSAVAWALGYLTKSLTTASPYLDVAETSVFSGLTLDHSVTWFRLVAHDQNWRRYLHANLEFEQNSVELAIQDEGRFAQQELTTMRTIFTYPLN